MWEISVKIPLGFGAGVRMAYLMIEKNACKFSKVRAGNFWLKKILAKWPPRKLQSGSFRNKNCSS